MRGLILAGALLAALPAYAGEVITGRASVIDADTIEIAVQRIRLDGIDAPESWQTCRRSNGEGYSSLINALMCEVAKKRIADLRTGRHVDMSQFCADRRIAKPWLPILRLSDCALTTDVE